MALTKVSLKFKSDDAKLNITLLDYKNKINEMIDYFLGADFGNLRLYDTDQSDLLDIKWNENDSNPYTLNFKVNSGNRTIDLNESLTIVDGQNIELHASGGEKAQLAIDTQNAERTLDLSANLTVEATSVINSDLSTDANWVTSGTITCTGAITSGTTATAGSLVLYDGSSHTITIDVPSIAGSYALTLPTTDGAANEYLETDGSGNLSWVAAPAVESHAMSTHTDEDTYNILTSGTLTLNSAATPPDSQSLIQANSLGGISMLVWSADNLYIGFDIYWDGSAWKSLDAGSNFDIVKGGAVNDKLVIRYDSGVAIGSTPTMNAGIVLDTAGNVGIGVADPDELLEVNGNVKADTFLLAAGVTPNLGWLSDLNLGTLEEGETIAYDSGTSKFIDAWGVEYDNPRLVWKMYSDFMRAHADASPPWTGVALVNGTITQSGGEANHPGVLRFNCSTTVYSGYSFLIDTNALVIDGRESSEFIFKTPADFTDKYARLGFQDSTTYAAPTDGIFLDMSENVLSGKTYAATATSTTGTTYTLAASTWYRIKLAVNNDATLVTYNCYNAAGTVLWTNTLAANIPTAQLGHGVLGYIAAGDDAGVVIFLDMMTATRAGSIVR